ncbi:MAG TPA: response regulator transcription factor [Candidatus Acidoferrum sp.]
MNPAARRSTYPSDGGQPREMVRGARKGNTPVEPEAPRFVTNVAAGVERRARVYIAAANRLLREALSRMLTRQGDIEVVGLEASGPFRVEGLSEEKADILLLTSRGSLVEDIFVIRQVRLKAPTVRILLVGMTEDEVEFFQYVRAGIKGYLPRDASAEDVLEAMHAVQAGDAVCPGSLCALLFRFFEREATSVHSATIHPRLGLTRREQQIVPLIAQGLTNKEIANQFCLSEQTVKNHLYRMKHKVGAGDRFGIVHLCRTQGFLV